MVYVLFKKIVEGGVRLPFYEVYTEEPALDKFQKLITLNQDECVEVAKCYLTEDRKSIEVNTYRISNINNIPNERLVESYLLERFVIA